MQSERNRVPHYKLQENNIYDKTIKKSNKKIVRNRKTVKNTNNKTSTSDKKNSWKYKMKNGKSIDTIILDIFRKEGGDANNCPKSITLEMLACATAASGWSGKKGGGIINDAGLLVKDKAKDALWNSYYKITLISLLHNNTSGFGKYFESRGIYDYEETKPDEKIFTGFEFGKAAPYNPKPNKIRHNKNKQNNDYVSKAVDGGISKMSD